MSRGPSRPASAGGAALDYPLGDLAPAIGELVDVAPGYRWTRLDIGLPIGTINAWILADSGGSAIVDTGLATDEAREAWSAIFQRLTAEGAPARRLIITHHHADHSALSKWMAESFALPVVMPEREHQIAVRLEAEVVAGIGEKEMAFWKVSGWTDSEIQEGRRTAFSDLEARLEPPPKIFTPLKHDDVLDLGAGRRLQAIYTGGHCPAHACLWDEANRILIAGDQVLPEAPAGLGVTCHDMEADLLGDWLASAEELRLLPEDTLVLPSHGRPYRGLRSRIDRIKASYASRLDRLLAHLATPRSTADCHQVLFNRPMVGVLRPLATGESRSYLNRLTLEGRAIRSERDGVLYWRAA